MYLLNSLMNRWRVKRMRKGFSSIPDSAIIMPPAMLRGKQYIRIGEDCYFGSGCRIEAWDEYRGDRFTPCVEFGARTRIAGDTHIGAINAIVLGDDVLVGREVFITDHAHGNSSAEEQGVAPNDRPLFSKGPVVIGDRVWICEKAIILPNVHIGDGAIVAAGAVVAHDVPESCVVAGNPARVVKCIA